MKTPLQHKVVRFKHYLIKYCQVTDLEMSEKDINFQGPSWHVEVCCRFTHVTEKGMQVHGKTDLVVCNFES